MRAVKNEWIHIHYFAGDCICALRMALRADQYPCFGAVNDENKTKSFYLIKIITKEKTKSSDILTRKVIFALQNRKEMPLCE